MKGFSGRYLWLNSKTLLEDATLIVEDGKVKDALQSGEGLPAHLDEIHRFEDGLIIPGLVNAHTHLELSILRGKVPFRGSFLKWVGRVGLRRALASPRKIAQSVERGLNESLASNSSLSLLDEMKFIRCRFPEVKPSDILRMATEAGAVALGVASHKGTLEPGKDADFAVARSPCQSHDPWDRLFDAETRIASTVVAGEIVYCEER